MRGVSNGLGILLMVHAYACVSFACYLVCFVFIQHRAIILACAPCSSHLLSRYVSSMYLFLKLLMMRWHQIHKSPSLPWCIFFCFLVQVTKREDKDLKQRKAHVRPWCEAPGHCREKLNGSHWEVGLSCPRQQVRFVGSGSDGRYNFTIFQGKAV